VLTLAEGKGELWAGVSLRETGDSASAGLS